MESELLQKLANKSISKARLYQTVAENFDLLPQIFIGLSSSKATIRYGCSKILMDLSATFPEKLYPNMNVFVDLLASKYRILVWNAMTVIANLCVVDKDKQFDAIFKKYYSFLNDEYLVTVANVVGNSGKIALAKPYLIPKITTAVLKVEHIATTPHLTEECKKVIAETVIKSFNLYFDLVGDTEKAKVLSFVKKHANSPRKSLKIEAENFLKRWSK